MSEGDIHRGTSQQAIRYTKDRIKVFNRMDFEIKLWFCHLGRRALDKIFKLQSPQLLNVKYKSCVESTQCLKHSIAPKKYPSWDHCNNLFLLSLSPALPPLVHLGLAIRDLLVTKRRCPSPPYLQSSI